MAATGEERLPGGNVGGAVRVGDTVRRPYGSLACDAVGTAWPVEIGRAEIHVVGPFAFDQVRCVRGTAGADTPCTSLSRAPRAALR